MVIRSAQSGDKDGILKLLSEVNEIHHNGRPDIFKKGTKYNAAQLDGILKEQNTHILVADEGGCVLGYVFCMLLENDKDGMLTDIKTLYIDDLCVEEAQRGKHIGKALYNAALQLAKDLGCYNLTLNVWCLNEDAYKFYTACDMKPLKIYMERIV